MSEKTFMLATALKMQQWEIAKGHLKALVVLQGGHHGAGDNSERYTRIRKAVDEFIEVIEGEELNT